MPRYWVHLDNRVQGPYEIPALRKLPGFNFLTQVCLEGQDDWRMADEVIEIKAYFSAPPRTRATEESLMESGADKRAGESINSLGRVETLPPPGGLITSADGVETLPDTPLVSVGNTAVQAAPTPDGLRRSCATCGYKNPREVNACMKCGTPLKAPGAAEPPKISLNVLAKADETNALKAAVEKPPEAASPAASEPAVAPTVEIPVKRIALILSGILATGAVLFGVRHAWMSWKHKGHSNRTVVVQKAPGGKDDKPAEMKEGTAVKSKKHGRVDRKVAAALPGVSAEDRPVSKPAKSERKSEDAPRAKAKAPVEESAEPAEPPSTYRVVSQAYPLNHRTSSPVDSKYAVKRRGESGLWSNREEEAIQMAQNQRIYGGLRTIRRNSEILMQILRDREYSTAFESGRRIYLFNDVDWAAVQKGNPTYEVQLTFSGGKEADGSSRTPLRFSFNVDLERRTVEPGGSGLVKANTMHAFYDESRIPPEERRSVAKDTEELVKAAAPGASPLTLESVTKSYAGTYSYAAMTRVADAFGLSLVNKKLARATSSVGDFLPPEKEKSAEVVKTPRPETAVATSARSMPKLIPSASGTIQYTMEKGQGKEKRVTVRVPSSATPGKLWEAFTAYDRLTQYVPGVLVSQRQGQDGPAVIVHTVSLTRFGIFVFKINLHLRIIEHAKQYRLEFERLAGDFEKFSGYVEINADPSGLKSMMDVNITLIPKGYIPQWALRPMAQNYLVPVLEAIRAKAESY